MPKMVITEFGVAAIEAALRTKTKLQPFEFKVGDGEIYVPLSTDTDLSNVVYSGTFNDVYVLSRDSVVFTIRFPHTVSLKITEIGVYIGSSLFAIGVFEDMVVKPVGLSLRSHCLVYYEGITSALDFNYRVISAIPKIESYKRVADVDSVLSPANIILSGHGSNERAPTMIVASSINQNNELWIGVGGKRVWVGHANSVDNNSKEFTIDLTDFDGVSLDLSFMQIAEGVGKGKMAGISFDPATGIYTMDDADFTDNDLSSDVLIELWTGPGYCGGTSNNQCLPRDLEFDAEDGGLLESMPTLSDPPELCNGVSVQSITTDWENTWVPLLDTKLSDATIAPINDATLRSISGLPASSTGLTTATESGNIISDSRIPSSMPRSSYSNIVATNNPYLGVHFSALPFASLRKPTENDYIAARQRWANKGVDYAQCFDNMTKTAYMGSVEYFVVEVPFRGTKSNIASRENYLKTESGPVEFYTSKSVRVPVGAYTSINPTLIVPTGNGLKTILVPPHTRLIVWEEENFTGRTLLDVIGPILLVDSNLRLGEGRPYTKMETDIDNRNILLANWFLDDVAWTNLTDFIPITCRFYTDQTLYRDNGNVQATPKLVLSSNYVGGAFDYSATGSLDHHFMWWHGSFKIVEQS